MNGRIHALLFSPLHASTLSLFRILFGAAMAYQCLYYVRIDYAFQFMAGPEILFSYPYFEFVQPLPVAVLRALQWMMLIAALLITLGWRTRWASGFFFLSFSYFTLIDKTLFNNHLYLFMLLALLFTFVDADRCYSLTNRFRKKKPSPYIEAWQLYLFRFMVFLVYFYGGVMKLDREWLSGNIAEAALAAKGLEDAPFFTAFFTYGGVLYDLLIGFFLLYKPTRFIAVLFVLFFNLTNHFYLFDDIGVFPFAMIACTVVFFEPERTANALNKVFGNTPATKKQKPQPPALAWSTRKQVTAVGIGVFVAFQLIFPFRYLLFTSNPEWSGIASRFAWRMKMQTRTVEKFEMTVQDLPDGEPFQVDYKAFLSVNQHKQLVMDPYNIIQLAQYIAEEAKDRGMRQPSVRADINVSYNLRPAQRMILPEALLEQQSIYRFTPQGWLRKLED
jgi:hypothetical protein